MKIIIILTILLVSVSAHSLAGHKTHKDYAVWFEKIANTKVKHTFVYCSEESRGYYSCELLMSGVGTKEGYEYEWKFLQYHLRELNRDVESVYGVPMLVLKRGKHVTI